MIWWVWIGALLVILVPLLAGPWLKHIRRTTTRRPPELL